MTLHDAGRRQNVIDVSRDFWPQGTQPLFFQFRTLPVASRLVPRSRLPLGTEPRVFDAVSR